MKWLIIALACLGIYCAMHFWMPERAKETVTTFAGYPVTWNLVAIILVVWFGSHLKST